ncbi:redoxin domain-containing protein [Parasphingopyxis algicola]|uniref:redoxin domain-containing protein n=1 Tax=Parasphingopyxis algicola TaxID=2026624 RepID=UPI0015A1FC1B|nr:redoxin domain-containing protein [Parasphingopyxis algicola]QLC26429.1 redoxin domain-containing protein [Parasphingopyxis algicola]
MMHSTLLPGTTAPDLTVALASDGSWTLSEQVADSFILIDFYRGMHCPRCQLHILDLRNKLPRFAERGTRCIAISMDDESKARTTAERWGVGDLDLGFGLTEAQARAWGLYLTDSINEREPMRFSEPAVIMVRPGTGEIYSAVYGTNPFNRVHCADMLEGIDALLARDYPPRGVVA